MTEDSLRTITGRIRSIEPSKRGITLWDNDGMIDGGTWDPVQDKEFTRLKPGWYATVTLEKRGDKWIAISQAKAPRPAGQPKPGQVQDQRMIMRSVLLKAWTELWMQTSTPDTVTFKDARQEIRDAVDEDMGWIMRGGA